MIKKLTDTDKEKMKHIARLAAERNLGSGVWLLATAQLFLSRVAEQPYEHLYLINK